MTESTFQAKKPQSEAVTCEYKICSCAAGCCSGLHYSFHVGTRTGKKNESTSIRMFSWQMIPSWWCHRGSGTAKEINRNFSHYFKASFSPAGLPSVHASSPLRTFTVTRQHIHIFWTNLWELSPGLRCHFSLYLQAAAGPNPTRKFLFSRPAVQESQNQLRAAAFQSGEMFGSYHGMTWLWHVADQKWHRGAHRLNKGWLKRNILYIMKRCRGVSELSFTAGCTAGILWKPDNWEAIILYNVIGYF